MIEDYRPICQNCQNYVSHYNFKIRRGICLKRIGFWERFFNRHRVDPADMRPCFELHKKLKENQR